MFRWLQRLPFGPSGSASAAAADDRDRVDTDGVIDTDRGPTASAYAGDYPGPDSGPLRLEYAPHPDGHPDPGEVVWAWVPFEEDTSRGKDRPVLVIGHDRELLLGLMLTSKDHDRDAAAEARRGRHWLDVGAGAWDGQRRPSEVRLDRILRLRPAAVRREGATLPKSIYDQVAAGVTQYAPHR